MQMIKQISAAIFVVCVGFGLSQPAEAALLFEVQQVGPDVVITGAGSLNITTAPIASPPGGFIEGFLNSGTSAAVPVSVVVGDLDGDGTSDLEVFELDGVADPFSTGTGAAFNADSVTGDMFGFRTINTNDAQVYLEPGYVSNTILNGTATFNLKTLADFGLNIGDSSQSFYQGQLVRIVVIGPSASPVPEPGAIAMALTGLGILGARRVFRSRKSSSDA